MRDALPGVQHGEHTGFAVLRWLWCQARDRRTSCRAYGEDSRRRAVSNARAGRICGAEHLRGRTDLVRPAEHAAAVAELAAGRSTRAGADSRSVAVDADPEAAY